MATRRALHQQACATHRRIPVTGRFAEAADGYPSGVTLVTIADGREDTGVTVSSFCVLSDEPPLVLVALAAGSYPAQLLTRLDTFAVTVLAAGQRVLAGRFAAAGRPGARLLLEGVPQQRGALSGALIPGGGVTAMECRVTQRLPAGDHLAVIAEVIAIPYLSGEARPLIRFHRRYRDLAGD